MAQPNRMLPRALSPRLRQLGRLRGAPWQKQRFATAATQIKSPSPETFEPNVLPSTPSPERQQAIRQAKPFSDFLTDTYNRQHDYLRISLTERCNLRCLYCMPEEGIQLSPNRELLTTAEIHYLSALFVDRGVTKIRLTGGEPTVRKDIVPLMHQIGSLRRNGLKELALTTNGISLHRKLDEMVAAGLTGVNISLDTLDPFQFQLLTRRQGFSAVMKSIDRVKEMNKLGAGIKLKINCVVMRGLNDHQVLPFVDMTQDQDVEVRFIEYMPFGGNKWSQNKMMSYADMLDMIREKYPTIERLKGAKNDTSKTWQVPGHAGRVGFITSMTHNFCGSCNRLRITSDGALKVCLHGEAEVSLRDLLRDGHGGEPMDEEAFEALRQLELDRSRDQSFNFDDGQGWQSKEQQLLRVIGGAVKRKKEKHAGMGELENMKNRPMILIGEHANRRSPIKSHGRFLRRAHPSTPWSKIPFHLMYHPAPTGVHIRPYSSDSQKGNPGLGFQSLSSLFSGQPRSGRYSRPREHLDAPKPGPPDLATPSAVPDEKRPREPFFGSFISNPSSTQTQDDPTGGRPPSQTSLVRKHEVGSDRLNRQETSIEHFSEEDTPHPTSSQETARESWRTARSSKHQQPQKRPNPFEAGPPLTSDTPTSPVKISESGIKPWGLSREARTKLDTLTDAGSHTAKEESGDSPFLLALNGSTGDESVRMPPLQTTPQGSHEVAAAATGARPSTAFSRSVKVGEQAAQGKKLTHVKPSGEAHMVDVAAKPSTRRVAVARTVVQFRNSESLKLITENSNKKGDVLGTARIAGIMAAKKTSDLIPLCHPLAISNAELDITTRPSRGIGGDYGTLELIARIECVGPTGVEMEAMTAVTAAALTVYDMCKAVDRAIDIQTTRLVYKSGGKSGVYINKAWLGSGGLYYIRLHGLEGPQD